MAEELIIFKPGDRFATQTDKGKVSIYQVAKHGGPMRADEGKKLWPSQPDTQSQTRC